MKKLYFFAAMSVLALNIACNNSNTPSENAAATKGENAATASDADGVTLMAKNDCNTCHTKDTKIVGPSFTEIAGKYPNTPENITLLTKKVMEGGSGVWGNTPMAAHPNLAKPDAEKIVGYILSLGATK